MCSCCSGSLSILDLCVYCFYQIWKIWPLFFKNKFLSLFPPKGTQIAYLLSCLKYSHKSLMVFFPPFFLGSFWIVSFVVSSSLLISYFVLSNLLFILFFISDIVYFLFLKLWFRPFFNISLVSIYFFEYRILYSSRYNCLMPLSANSNICVNSVFQLINFFTLYISYFSASLFVS